MCRNNLRIVKPGPEYSIDKAPKKFVSAFVTNTRLMGVLVLYIHWQLQYEDSLHSLHQFFYVETTETGIESYKSIYGNNQKSLMEAENAMIGGLGGEKVSLTRKESILLVQKYAEMTKQFGKALPDETDEYAFIIDEEIEHTPVEEKYLFQKTCVGITSAEQLINYFLIRYTSADYAGADCLSYRPFDRSIFPGDKSQILCTNKIEERRDDNGNLSYMCESLIEDDRQYRIVISEIRIEQLLVASFEKISDFAVSSAEAAMKLARPELITVFEIMDDRHRVMGLLDDMYPATLQKNTALGKVYIIFKNNNDHVKEKFYRLNDDVKGVIYVTDEDQLLIAGYNLAQIHRLENEMQYSGFASTIVALAKYEFKESVFYDFMQSSTGDFLHYIEYAGDYDPEDE